MPVPLRLINRILDRMRFPVISTGLAVFVPLFSYFYLYRVLLAENKVLVFGSYLELTGFSLMVSALPTYLVMCLVTGVRLSNTGYLTLSRLCRDGKCSIPTRYPYARYWPVAIVLGVFYTLNFNVVWDSLSLEPSSPEFMESLSVLIGQLVIWCVVGMVLFFSIHEGFDFHRFGKQVPIDLYDLDKLNSFGRVSLAGFLMVMGGLALSTLQSIDQGFSWDRYRNAFIVAVPAAVVLTLLPSWSMHRRIRRHKLKHLAEINQAIANYSKSLDTNSLQHMNGLLARRTLIQSLRTWPMDLSIFSRFILYVFIPPLAWAGAALMELFLDSVLAG